MAILFEYAIMVEEKRDAADNIVEEAELVSAPKYLLAKDQVQATLAAGATIPEGIRTDAQKMDRLVVIVRPF